MSKQLISVCICTYQRPALLGELLKALAAQQIGDFTHEIVVVDNDATGSARNVVDNFREQHPELSCKYDIQPEKNIALTRNRTLALAEGDWIAFIDDDEIPVNDWLVRLRNTADAYQSRMVFAPVVPKYLPGTADWVIKGKFFERPRYRTGTSIPCDNARTGNALVDAKLLRQFSPVFDPALGLSGGEDSALFDSLYQQGQRFVWCDEAAVMEEVPLDRANLRWLITRSLRTSQGYARRVIHSHSIFSISILFGKGVLGVLLGMFLFLIFIPFGKPNSYKYLRRAAEGVGKLSVIFGFNQIQEYR